MIAEGLVFNINRAALHDGPGIRTTVFLKGCPLRCIWCHNPESQDYRVQLSYNEIKCISCRKCKQSCASSVHTFEGNKHFTDYKKCILSEKCVKVCPTGALSIIGKMISVEDVMKEVLKDKKFYQSSGGGITVSGGEPTAQIDFLATLLENCKRENIYTAIETCGFAKQSDYERILPLVDLFLFDYKITGKENHKYYTSVSNELILSNLDFISNKAVDIILRCPIILKINDNDEHFRAIATLSNKYESIIGTNIMAYNNWGSSKNKNIGNMDYFETDMPSQEEKDSWIRRLKEFGAKKVSIG